MERYNQSDYGAYYEVKTNIRAIVEALLKYEILENLKLCELREQKISYGFTTDSRQNIRD